ncbi:MAG: putative signal transducing protein [Desulfotignum sp.]
MESQGIKCEVKGEYLFGARGELPITPETAPSVWILDETKINEAKAGPII